MAPQKIRRNLSRPTDSTAASNAQLSPRRRLTRNSPATASVHHHAVRDYRHCSYPPPPTLPSRLQLTSSPHQVRPGNLAEVKE